MSSALLATGAVWLAGQCDSQSHGMTGAFLASGADRAWKGMVTVGTIVVHEFITLDGVIEAPSSSFDCPYDSAIGEATGRILGSSKAILLGRRTYQEFAPAWSGRTAEEDPGAPLMNELPRYVVSAPLQAGDWTNTTILGPYRAEAIRGLKDRVDGGIYSGSGTLVRALLADGLADELHLFVFPLVHGASQRLFADNGPVVKLALAGSQACSNGAPHLMFRPAG